MARLLPLVLSVKSKNWRENDLSSGEADAEFRAVRGKALDRDAHTCRFCGFQQRPRPGTPPSSAYYMQVHHFDDDHHNNRLENLITACMHCHAVQHIGLWGGAKEAVIVYLPEMDQAALNHVCRHVLVAKRWCQKVASDEKALPDRKKSARDIGEAMDALFAKLLAREADAQRILKTSDAEELANVLLNTPDDAYERRHRTLANFRLLLLGHHRPKDKPADIMPDIVDAWMANGGPYGNLSPATWSNLLQQVPLR